MTDSKGLSLSPRIWQWPCFLEGSEGDLMLDSIRRLAALPRVSILPIVSAGTVFAFFWLLIQDRIHPFVIYLAQIYLSF